MQMNLMLLFGIVGGSALCVFVGTKSHPIAAASMAMLVLWAIVAAYNPKLGDKLELFIGFSLIAIFLFMMLTRPAIF